jgi:hypothetical protein
MPKVLGQIVEGRFDHGEMTERTQLSYLQKKEISFFSGGGIEHFLLGKLRTTQAFFRLDLICELSCRMAREIAEMPSGQPTISVSLPP